MRLSATYMGARACESLESVSARGMTGHSFARQEKWERLQAIVVGNTLFF